MLVGSKIYGIPYQNDSVLIINTASNSADTTTITGLSGGWWGGAEYGGKVFGVPNNLLKTSCVLVIDTVTNLADTWSICGTVSADPPYFMPFTNSWRGAVASGSKIYGIPWEGKSLLMIDATPTAPTKAPTESPTDAPTASPTFAPTPSPTAKQMYAYTLSGFTVEDFDNNTTRGNIVRGAFIETVVELTNVSTSRVSIISVSWSTHIERREDRLVVVEFIAELSLPVHNDFLLKMVDTTAGGFGAIFLSKLAAAGELAPSGLIVKPYKVWPVGSLGNPSEDKRSSTPTTLILILAFAGLVIVIWVGVVLWVCLGRAVNSGGHRYTKLQLQAV